MIELSLVRMLEHNQFQHWQRANAFLKAIDECSESQIELFWNWYRDVVMKFALSWFCRAATTHLRELHGMKNWMDRMRERGFFDDREGTILSYCVNRELDSYSAQMFQVNLDMNRRLVMSELIMDDVCAR